MSTAGERSSYKAGNQYRIVNMSDIAKKAYSIWKEGDIITLSDPPTRDTYGPSDGKYTKLNFLLSYNNGKYWVPAEFCEPIGCGESVATCTCSITTLMTAGCTCGHLRKEVKS